MTLEKYQLKLVVMMINIYDLACVGVVVFQLLKMVNSKYFQILLTLKTVQLLVAMIKKNQMNLQITMIAVERKKR